MVSQRRRPSFRSLRHPRPDDGLALLDALRAVRDGLRAGLSLPQAIARGAAVEGSPLSGVGQQLTAGLPLVECLEAEARNRPGTDVAFCLAVLAAQARAGGDPRRAVQALEDRVRRRLAAAREARSLTTQARMSARVMMCLTPGFLVLLAVSDPGAAAAGFADPAVRAAVLSGLALQGAGSWWISNVISAPVRERPAGRLAAMPVIRVITGAPRNGSIRDAQDAAQAAELLSMLLGSGMSLTGALQVAAGVCDGELGDALRRAVAAVRAGAGCADAVRAELGATGCAQAARLSDALASTSALGVPVAETLAVLADEIAEARAAQLTELVRAASVKVLVPLGVVILPAFVLACLVPLFVTGIRGLEL